MLRARCVRLVVLLSAGVLWLRCCLCRSPLCGCAVCAAGGLREVRCSFGSNHKVRIKPSKKTLIPLKVGVEGVSEQWGSRLPPVSTQENLATVSGCSVLSRHLSLGKLGIKLWETELLQSRTTRARSGR